jgi:putative NADH-flavin reductase
MPIKAIARRIGISKNTVKRALAAEEPPKYRRVRAPTGQAVEGVSRLVWVSAHGVGDSRGDSGLVFEHVLRPLLWRAEYADKEQQETAVRTSDLAWTIVRPARLTNGPSTHRYRAADRIKLNWHSHISRADVADFVIDESHKPQFLRKCPTLTAQ